MEPEVALEWHPLNQLFNLFGIAITGNGRWCHCTWGLEAGVFKDATDNFTPRLVA
jgi:hypothetical protein